MTSRAYPADEWARRLDQVTPRPLTGTAGDGWREYLGGMQEHLRDQTMAEKQVFLGVRLRARAASHRAIAAVWRRPGNIEHARLVSQVEQVDETVALPGLGGRPVTAGEMEWLLCRSVGLGLPGPHELSAHPARGWEADNLPALTDQVQCEAAPFGRTVQVTSRDTRRPLRRHVAVMSIGRLEEIEAPDPGWEPWLAATDRLPLGVEWSCRIDVLSGGEARKAIQRKLLTVRDMQRHHAEHDSRAST